MDITIDTTLDCQGLSCPMPLLKLKKALGAMESGQVIEMLGTDPGTENDIEKAVKKLGCEYLGNEHEGDVTHFFIRKG